MAIRNLHARHQRAIYQAGSIRGAVESGCLRSGVMYEYVQSNVPFVLAGSLRDDGPLPDTITDMNQAQDAYAAELKGAGLVLCLGVNAAFRCGWKHAAQLGENRLRRHQPGSRHKSERSRHRPGGRRGYRCRLVSGFVGQSPDLYTMKRKYTEQHARAGVKAELPEIETWENQYPGYEIEIRDAGVYVRVSEDKSARSRRADAVICPRQTMPGTKIAENVHAGLP